MEHQVKEKIYEVKWFQDRDLCVGEIYEESLPEALRKLMDLGFIIVSVHLK